jgi:hypothetical protein
MSEESFKAGAEAIRASAELGSKAIDAGTSFGVLFKGAITEKVGMLEDRWKAQRWKQRVELVTDAHRYLEQRGISGATRDIPMPFAVKLLQNGELEEDEDLRDVWSRLLANAADAGSGTEPRVTYVEILSRMTAIDARNLETLVRTTIRHSGNTRSPFVSTFTLPESSQSRDELGGHAKPLTEPVIALSVSNMMSLGLLVSATGTFGGSTPIYEWVSVTPLGLEFYWACARQPKATEWNHRRSDPVDAAKVEPAR